ncbi:MAG: DUF1599 domain-containing protein [Bacteroidales bacterium]
MLTNTSKQYDEVVEQCKEIFNAKMTDYGYSWRILRPSSLTDQIYIKANRIRSIQCKGNQKIQDKIDNEFIAIINYSIMALIQLESENDHYDKYSEEELSEKYIDFFNQAKDLMMKKNHDYGEAWRNMRISSIDDIILMKLMRIKQIEDNCGKTLVSEGIDSNYFDIINYSVFAMILINEQNSKE